MRPLILFTAFVLGFGGLAARAQESTMQKPKKFKQKVTRNVEFQYLEFLPQGYEPRGKKRWPLILFLHGAGERGDDVQKVSVHGPPKLVKTKPDLPFVIISPQCPAGKRWVKEDLLAFLDGILKQYRVDTNRVYLTGLSMGGYGTWSLGAAYPDRFAAIAPICGGGEIIDVLLGSRERAAALKSLPVWAFHGAKDTTVPLEESERMVAALKRAGCKDVKLTVYPDAKHDSWTATYENPELFAWFLSHERKR
ncbi:MAG: prolyl oligopeptidase family serine peptidase [Verrucomicrobiota bacterium]